MIDELSIEALDREWDQIHGKFASDSHVKLDRSPLGSHKEQILLG